MDPGLLILGVSANLLQAKNVNELLLPGGQRFLQGFKPGHQGLLPGPYVPSIGMAGFFKIRGQVCDGVDLFLRKTLNVCQETLSFSRKG